ncbi:MAG: hypothetical protein R2794_13440 [Chitinophagales bacterium]
MNTKSSIFLFFMMCCISVYAQTTINSATFGGINGRMIGPATTSGRITCIDALNSDTNIMWVGSAGGGVWKSKNQGTTYKSVFDDNIQSIGTICIDQKHPDTVWVGTGECWVRNTTGIGNGLYRTVNGGDKFELVGLEHSERIARVIVDPANSNTIYVAALGALWADNPERGVFISHDFGKTWNKSLYVNAGTGCAALVMDPKNDQVLYAAMWDFRRSAYDFRSGGPGSGLYKTSDGGATWNKLDMHFAGDTIGRIALSISPVDGAVYALIEAEHSALYKSMDNGATWTKMSEQDAMGERPFYFSNIYADPKEADRVYKPGFNLLVSNNGGKIFQGAAVEGGAYHSDLHAMYVSPIDNRLVYIGSDGGVYISRDKGNTWSHCENLPVAQFYHVSTDNRSPYYVYGGLQDNGSWTAPSSQPGGIQNSSWKTIGYGDGFNAYPDASDRNVVYWQYQGGRLYRSNLQSGESKFIKPFPDQTTGDLRFNWNAPVEFGNKSGWLYIGSQYLYVSKDKGDTWQRISGDLTTNDPHRQQQEKSGGITTDNTTAENNTTIFSICESPLDEKIIWVGTDDGNIFVTRDGGSIWNKCNANINGLPAYAVISGIDAGKSNAGEAFVAVDAHQNGDMTPYLFYTKDFGASWSNISPTDSAAFCRVIKQDTKNEDLLFLGTEMGLYVSLDRGKAWVHFTNQFPAVSVQDIEIQQQQNDLVLATHGRGIIILDDITPLRNMTQEVIASDFAFLPTRPYYLPKGGITQDFPGDDEFVGNNPNGAPLIAYYLKKRHVFGDMYLEVFDANGNLIKKLPAGTRKGINIVALNLTMKPPKVPSSPNPLFEAAFGPEVEPGTYTVVVTQGEEKHQTSITIQYNPENTHPEADRKIRRDNILRLFHMLEELAYIDQQIMDIQDGAQKALTMTEDKKLKLKLQMLVKQTAAMHDAISATQPGEGGVAGQIRLREKIAEVYGAIGGYDGKPTNVQLSAVELYAMQVADMQKKLDALIAGDLNTVNTSLEKMGKEKIALTSKETFFKED